MIVAESAFSNAVSTKRNRRERTPPPRNRELLNIHLPLTAGRMSLRLSGCIIYIGLRIGERCGWKDGEQSKQYEKRGSMETNMVMHHFILVIDAVSFHQHRSGLRCSSTLMGKAGKGE